MGIRIMALRLIKDPVAVSSLARVRGAATDMPMAMTEAALLPVQVNRGLPEESSLVAAMVLVMARAITSKEIFLSIRRRRELTNEKNRRDRKFGNHFGTFDSVRGRIRQATSGALPSRRTPNYQRILPAR